MPPATFSFTVSNKITLAAADSVAHGWCERYFGEGQPYEFTRRDAEAATASTHTGHAEVVSIRVDYTAELTRGVRVPDDQPVPALPAYDS